MLKNELQVLFENTPSVSYNEKVKSVEDFIISLKGGVEGISGGVPEKVAYPSFFKYKHSFAEGLYIREMIMEKGSMVFSAIHKHSFPFFLLSGHLAISTEKGVEDFIAPCYIITPRGTKRIGYAIKESTVVTVHKNPDNLRNIEEIDNYNVVFTWKDYREYINKTDNEKNK